MYFKYLAIDSGHHYGLCILDGQHLICASPRPNLISLSELVLTIYHASKVENTTFFFIFPFCEVAENTQSSSFFRFLDGDRLYFQFRHWLWIIPYVRPFLFLIRL
jgi:hypothetical protein